MLLPLHRKIKAGGEAARAGHRFNNNVKYINIMNTVTETIFVTNYASAETTGRLFKALLDYEAEFEHTSRFSIDITYSDDDTDGEGYKAVHRLITPRSGLFTEAGWADGEGYNRLAEAEDLRERLKRAEARLTA